jgi:hypothetical protein
MTCPVCKGTVESWHEEEFIGWMGHCAQCEMDVVQDTAQATNTD